MLETDEVDIDYFTPAGSTSLASIFGKSSASDETKENPSLKYVPPPPPDKCKAEEVKPTQWIFTCAVHGFEWINSGYTSRGKLGLAILKVVKTNNHSIILYDANKTTVSYVTISPKLNIHIRDILTISYYDNAQKYWCIKTSDHDMNKMLQLLKDLETTIVPKPLQEADREESGGIKVHNKYDVVIKDEEDKEEHDIDTDFDMNQKTKDSILKRMANMGHSVLPAHGNSKGLTSDSSDSNDIDDSKKNFRHKPAKIPSKRCTDLSIQENEGNTACHSRKLAHKLPIEGQALVLSKNTSTTPCGGEMNIYISEQKISNSELRINVNRVSDKLDLVLGRLNDIVSIDKSNSFTSNFQSDIVHKLIKEYESKIKKYEYIMSSKGIDFHTTVKTHLDENVTDCCQDNVAHINKIDELQKQCREKDNVIRGLEKDISVLNENNVIINKDCQEKIENLVMEIKSLHENLNLKNEELDTAIKNSSGVNSSNQENCDIANKVKKIMNDTYEAISVNFDDKEAYSGEKIKAIIAIVIKKTTIQALQEL